MGETTDVERRLTTNIRIRPIASLTVSLLIIG